MKRKSDCNHCEYKTTGQEYFSIHIKLVHEKVMSDCNKSNVFMNSLCPLKASKRNSEHAYKYSVTRTDKHGQTG